MGEVLDKFTDHPQPFLLLSDSEPFAFAPWIDITRAKLAFDRLGIPNLKYNMFQSKSEIIIIQALCVLIDLVHDPEKACEALRLNITSPLIRLMHHENMLIRHNALEVLKILATNPYGRVTLARNKYVMDQLKKNFQDEELLVRSQAYRTLHTLAANWFAVEDLLKEGFLVIVINAIKECMTNPTEKVNDHLFYLLETLDCFMDFSDGIKIESIRHDIFDFKEILKNDDKKVKKAVLNVFSQIFKMKIGREGAMAHNFTEYLIPQADDEDEEMQTQIFSALMFTTVLSEGKRDAAKKGILEASLRTVLHPKTSLMLRRNAAKVLTNLAELPACRKTLQGEIKNLMKIQTSGDKTLEKQLDLLIDTIVWTP